MLNFFKSNCEVSCLHDAQSVKKKEKKNFDM